MRRPACRHHALLQLTRTAAGAWADLGRSIVQAVLGLTRNTVRAYVRTWHSGDSWR